MLNRDHSERFIVDGKKQLLMLGCSVVVHRLSSCPGSLISVERTLDHIIDQELSIRTLLGNGRILPGSLVSVCVQEENSL